MLSSAPVHVPPEVTAFFRAGGRIRRTYYRRCPRHGAVRYVVPTPNPCPSCQHEGRR